MLFFEKESDARQNPPQICADEIDVTAVMSSVEKAEFWSGWNDSSHVSQYSLYDIEDNSSAVWATVSDDSDEDTLQMEDQSERSHRMEEAEREQGHVRYGRDHVSEHTGHQQGALQKLGDLVYDTTDMERRKDNAQEQEKNKNETHNHKWLTANKAGYERPKDVITKPEELETATRLNHSARSFSSSFNNSLSLEDNGENRAVYPTRTEHFKDRQLAPTGYESDDKHPRKVVSIASNETRAPLAQSSPLMEIMQKMDGLQRNTFEQLQKYHACALAGKNQNSNLTETVDTDVVDLSNEDDCPDDCHGEVAQRSWALQWAARFIIPIIPNATTRSFALTSMLVLLLVATFLTLKGAEDFTLRICQIDPADFRGGELTIPKRFRYTRRGALECIGDVYPAIHRKLTVDYLWLAVIIEVVCILALKICKMCLRRTQKTA